MLIGGANIQKVKLHIIDLDLRSVRAMFLVQGFLVGFPVAFPPEIPAPMFLLYIFCHFLSVIKPGNHQRGNLTFQFWTFSSALYLPGNDPRDSVLYW